MNVDIQKFSEDNDISNILSAYNDFMRILEKDADLSKYIESFNYSGVIGSLPSEVNKWDKKIIGLILK